MLASRKHLLLLSAIAAAVVIAASLALVADAGPSPAQVTDAKPSPAPASHSPAGAYFPRPDATALFQLTQIIEHYGGNTPQPLFSGVMNGFRFESGPLQYQACAPDVRPRGLATEHGSPLLASSRLDFEATYVPAGFKADVVRTDRSGGSGHVLAGLCDGSVIFVDQTWQSPAGHLEVGRRATEPILGANFYSKDRLEAATIGGRPAIVVHPRFDGEEVVIYLRDDDSLWSIRSQALDVDMLRRVAEGIR